MNDIQSFATLAASVGAPSYVRHPRLIGWVREIAALTQARPHRVVRRQRGRVRPAVRARWSRRHASASSNAAKRPNSYLARSDPSRRRARRGPHVHLQRARGRRRARPTTGSLRRRCARRCNGLFDGCMRGRTMYVVPFSMGPLGSPDRAHRRRAHRQPYVVVNMRIMTRMGRAVYDVLGTDGAFVPCVHSVGAPLAAGRRTTSPWPCNPSTSTSCTFPRRARSGRSARATAATRCSARSASRCASPRSWAATRAGSPSTC